MYVCTCLYLPISTGKITILRAFGCHFVQIITSEFGCIYLKGRDSRQETTWQHQFTKRKHLESRLFTLSCFATVRPVRRPPFSSSSCPLFRFLPDKGDKAKGDFQKIPTAQNQLSSAVFGPHFTVDILSHVLVTERQHGGWPCMARHNPRFIPPFSISPFSREQHHM